MTHSPTPTGVSENGAEERLPTALPDIVRNPRVKDDEIAQAEDPIVAALFARGRNRRQFVEVARVTFPSIQVPMVDPDSGRPITRDGKPVLEAFSYRMRPLKRSERQLDEQAATERVPDPSFGRMAARDVVNQAEAECRMLYRATVPEDKVRFWDNLQLQSAYGVGSGWELIGEMLDDMQQAQALLALMELSGGTNVERTLIKS